MCVRTHAHARTHTQSSLSCSLQHTRYLKKISKSLFDLSTFSSLHRTFLFSSPSLPPTTQSTLSCTMGGHCFHAVQWHLKANHGHETIGIMYIKESFFPAVFRFPRACDLFHILNWFFFLKKNLGAKSWDYPSLGTQLKFKVNWSNQLQVKKQTCGNLSDSVNRCKYFTFNFTQSMTFFFCFMQLNCCGF